MSDELLAHGLDIWCYSGHGTFVELDEGVIESRGGPGILWYPAAAFTDFVLRVEWRVLSDAANSGVFVRIPALGTGDPERDWLPAVEEGVEVQIDERGIMPDAGVADSALHLTGALYGIAPAQERASLPVGVWNQFEISAVGAAYAVHLNGVQVSGAHLPERRLSGHIGLQAHDDSSRVQFRNLLVDAK